MLLKKLLLFFADKKLKTTSFNAFNANNIYYKKRTLLIKPVNEAAQLNSNSENLTINSEHLTKCVETSIPGIQRTLVFIINNKIGLFPTVIISNRALSAEIAFTEKFNLFSQNDLKGLENLIVCALIRAEREELTTIGTIKPAVEFQTQTLGVVSSEVIELAEASGLEVRNIIINEYSYGALNETFKLDIQNSEEKVEVSDTRMLWVGNKIVE